LAFIAADQNLKSFNGKLGSNALDHIPPQQPNRVSSHCVDVFSISIYLTSTRAAARTHAQLSGVLLSR
jgi:hypothetical protein